MNLIDKYLGEGKVSRQDLLKMIKNRKKGGSGSTQMECMECGHKFKKKLSSNAVEVKCPKCKGYDTNVA